MDFYDVEIRQKIGKGIEVFLDGVPVKGCRRATLDLSYDSVPELTMTVIVNTAKAQLPSVAVEDG